MKSKSMLITFIAAVAVVTVLLAVAALYDLQISKSVAVLEAGEYVSDSRFGRVLEICGETPIYLFLAYAISVVFWNALWFGKKWMKCVLLPACVLGCLIVSTYAPVRMYSCYVAVSNPQAPDAKFRIIDAVVGIGISAVALTSVGFSSKTSVRRQLMLALVILFTAGFSQVLTHGTKFINKRARYCAMNAINDFSAFTPWYKFNGLSESLKSLAESIGREDAIRSFPSGHSAAAGITFSLMALPYVFEKLNNRRGKLLCFCIGLVCTAAVATSRLIMGAHFLSDVVIGASLAFFSAYVSMWLICENRSIKRLDEYCHANAE